MADGADSDTSKIVSAATSFRQLTCILIRSTRFSALFGSLATCSVRVSEATDDAGSHQAKFEAGAACRIPGVENRHAHKRYLRFDFGGDVIGTWTP
ncbi:hypothetical protein AMK05_CH00777 [Rhizobium sp. N324]|nr:hypothetical protein AMK05_CH00777 [Rhizobium sp. N324]OYD02774.1 hypothetical protein AMK08_CH100773 [Rhizobium sp. N4311]